MPKDRTPATIEAPALLVAEASGAVCIQNTVAVRLMGEGVGRACWNVMTAMRGAEGLPCARGCVGALLRNAPDSPRHTPIRLHGQRLYLSCVPLEGRVACVLSGRTLTVPSPWQTLTPREAQVLQGLADGGTTASIATTLGLSCATVRTHAEKLRTKLEAKTRAQLVAIAFRLGLLD